MSVGKVNTEKCQAVDYENDNGYPLVYFESCRSYLKRRAAVMGKDNRKAFRKIWGNRSDVFRVAGFCFSNWYVEFEGVVYVVLADKQCGSCYEINGQSCLVRSKSDEERAKRFLTLVYKELKKIQKQS